MKEETDRRSRDNEKSNMKTHILVKHLQKKIKQNCKLTTN